METREQQVHQADVIWYTFDLGLRRVLRSCSGLKYSNSLCRLKKKKISFYATEKSLLIYRLFFLLVFLSPFFILLSFSFPPPPSLPSHLATSAEAPVKRLQPTTPR
jgi:hypothetical protein